PSASVSRLHSVCTSLTLQHSFFFHWCAAPRALPSFPTRRSSDLAGHRHHPEIVAQLEKLLDQPVGLTFVPHLTPMIRGMHSTIYARILPEARDTDFQALFEERYANEVFVDVMPQGSTPETRSVRASNMVRIAVHRPDN